MNKLRFYKVALVVLVALVLATGLSLAKTMIQYGETVEVQVTIKQNVPATVSLYGTGRAAEVIGEAPSQFRVKPGVYMLTAYVGGKRTSKVIDLKLGSPLSVVLDMDETVVLGSPGEMSFLGRDELVANGLTNEQAESVRLAFYNFNRKTRTITIDKGSVAPRPTPRESSEDFVLDFSVRVDGAPYSATVQYFVNDNIQLQLTDSKGKKVFDNAVSASEAS